MTDLEIIEGGDRGDLDAVRQRRLLLVMNTSSVLGIYPTLRSDNAAEPEHDPASTVYGSGRVGAGSGRVGVGTRCARGEPPGAARGGMIMGKFDRRSRDQKRKAKLKKRAQRSTGHESLAYHGKKYRTAEYVPLMARTETGIYESYVMTDRALTDDEVEAALEELITRMRGGPLPPLDDTRAVTVTGEGSEDLVAWNVRRNWQDMAERQPLPAREDLIGVLRTILHSLEIWRSQSMHSQGYLRYLEGFLKKAGVEVRQVTADLEPIPEPEEDPLLAAGRGWVHGGDGAAASGFAGQVEHLLRSGEAERVIGVCQQLLGETEDMSAVPLLQAFALRGHQAVNTEMG